MNKEWSLDALYRGYDDPNFLADIKKLEQRYIYCAEVANSLCHVNEKEELEIVLKALIEQNEVLHRLYAYTLLRQSTNTSDALTVSYLDKLGKMEGNAARIYATINRYIADTTTLDYCIEQSELLKEHAYFLQTIKENGKYLLNNEVEEVLSKMDITGGKAWEMLFGSLTSTLEIDFDGKTVTLSQIRNLAYDANKDVRKRAYEAELNAYAKIKDAIAYSLNNIKGQVLTECELRGFDSPLAMTLHATRMQPETLDAMLEAMQEYMTIFHAYLRRKAELLGYENGLPWYELFTPMGEANLTFTAESAKTYLLEHFRPFAKDMADMMETAFDDEWIDFYPRMGKVGGAFCENLPFLKQSRVLTNFDGSLGDVVTLAHELGHAYHGKMIESHSILNTNYTMPVAETASTFNENIIMNAAIDEASGDLKTALIETQLQDLTQIMCDIYSRFLFEKEVFERRQNEFLMSNDLEEIMLNAQIQAYGNGLDPTYLHPFMWTCKSHYYSSSLSFYNFPYAFGGLFARGLIVKYKEEKEAFVPKYRELLYATTICSVEDVAKIADIDLTTKDFWISALKTAEERVNEYLALTNDKLASITK